MGDDVFDALKSLPIDSTPMRRASSSANATRLAHLDATVCSNFRRVATTGLVVAPSSRHALTTGDG